MEGAKVYSGANDHSDHLTFPTLEQLEVRPMEHSPPPQVEALWLIPGQRPWSVGEDRGQLESRSGLALPPAGCVTWVSPSPF